MNAETCADFFHRLTLSGRKVKPIQVPPEIPSPELFPSCNQYDFLHEEVFEQDGIYEDIIAVDYKNMYVAPKQSFTF